MVAITKKATPAKAVTKKASAEKPTKVEISSFKVFKLFTKYDKSKNCDASGIVSKACFQKWKESRKKAPKNPQEAFRRALTAHIRGVDGRRPFAPEVEENLLIEVRKKKVWDCFEGCEGCFIGVQGFPSLGFHEAKKFPLKAALAKTNTNTKKKPSKVNNGKGSEVLFSRKRMHEDSIWNIKPLPCITETDEITYFDNFHLSSFELPGEADLLKRETDLGLYPQPKTVYDSTTTLKPLPLDLSYAHDTKKRLRVDQYSPRTARRLSALVANSYFGESGALFELDNMNDVFSGFANNDQLCF